MSAEAINSNGAFMQTMDANTRLFVLWTLFVVFCQCAGWTLSALGALNATGYAIAFLLFILIGYLLTKRANITPVSQLPKLTRRFKRPFPLAFLILATLAILGGIL